MKRLRHCDFLSANCELSRVKEENREQGVWGGRAAEALGLEGAVTREAFVDLVNNRVPGS
jgi:hypothetical protein